MTTEHNSALDSSDFADPPARPVRNEIATTRDGRDITRGYVDSLPLLPPTDQVLIARGAGNYRIYDEVLSDDQVAATFQQRRLAVVSREWEVIEGGSRRRDRAAADFIRDVLDHIRWDAVTDHMLYGVFYGYAVAELIWARDGANIVPDAIRVRDRRRFGFAPDMSLRLLTMSNPNGERLPDRKFWHFCTGANHDDEPYGIGLAHWLYWPVLFKRNGVKFWLIFLEKFGMPTAKGMFPRSASETDKQKLLDTLMAITTDSGVIIPEDMQIELIEAARAGRVDYVALHDRMNAAITKVVLGQTMTTEDGSSRSQAEVHMEVRQDLVKADADLINQSANRSWVRWLVDWNFPGAAYPQIWRRIEDEPDLKPQAERDRIIYDMGFRPTLDYITSTYGEGWEERTPQEAPADGQGTEPPSFAEDAMDTQHPARLQADRLAQDADPVTQAWLQQLLDMIDQAENLEQLREMVLAAWPDLDHADLTGLMQQALAASDLAGRYDQAVTSGLIDGQT